MNKWLLSIFLVTLILMFWVIFNSFYRRNLLNWYLCIELKIISFGELLFLMMKKYQTKLFWWCFNRDAISHEDNQQWKAKLKQFSKGVPFLPDIKTYSPKVDAIHKSGIFGRCCKGVDIALNQNSELISINK